MEVLVQRLDPGVPLPAYALPGDAGADVVTTVDAELAPGERAVFTPVAALPESERGAGGHGSTGGHAQLVGGT